MTFKCNECGHIFESGEEKIVVEKHGFSTPPYEEFKVCPRCNGFGYDEFVQNECIECGIEVEDSYCGLCEECLSDKINYENALDFLTESGNLCYFVFKHFYNMDYPKTITKEFEEELWMMFLRKKVEDFATQKTELLEMVVGFIKNEELAGFAEFLEGRGDI